MNSLADIIMKEGQYSEAERLIRETLDIERRVLGPEHPDTANSTYTLACIAARKGNRDEALPLLREAIDHGLSPADDLGIEKDSDLKSLHGDPRFDALVAHAKEKASQPRRSSKPRERDSDSNKDLVLMESRGGV